MENIFNLYYDNKNFSKKYKTKVKQKEEKYIDNLQTLNKLKIFDKKYIQNIFTDNNTILRCYSNAYYWIINKEQNIQLRNIGFYSISQNDVLIYIKELIINWCLNKKNIETYNNFNNSIDINDFIIKITEDTNYLNCIDCLRILNIINGIPIIIYKNDDIDIIIDSNKLYKKDEIKFNNKNSIHIQIIDKTKNIVNVIYYD
jgi:hypothetical protein